ncbi:uridine nucleosidase [Anaeramoeba flamelloides]|uniref:Uridine nucleosidase n=1 Tax=Anaeramoeba flamelloides TaxID=1746091 RepID=A0ABQ8Z2G2_9EUKA|nr:uridine nucleosidase [Anaeramoeba flamelloides]
MEKINLFYDCDPGIDDAFTILMLRDPKFNVIGISTEGGNVSIEDTTRNAILLKYIANLNEEIPVIRGVSLPLIVEEKCASEVHGDTGIGPKNYGFTRVQIDNEEYIKRAINVDENGKVFKSGILCMYEQIMGCKGKVTILATARLTNLALLFTSFPDVEEKIERIVIMGGSLSKGNVTSSAEFNIYTDPHAAEIVFRLGTRLEIVLVPLGCTHLLYYNEKILNSIKSKLGDTTFSKILIETKLFCQKSMKDLSKLYPNNEEEDTEFTELFLPHMHDPCSCYYLLDPQMFETKRLVVHVECNSETTRGAIIWDNLERNGMKKNVLVATSVKVEQFWEKYISLLEIVNKDTPVNKN